MDFTKRGDTIEMTIQRKFSVLLTACAMSLWGTAAVGAETGFLAPVSIGNYGGAGSSEEWRPRGDGNLGNRLSYVQDISDCSTSNTTFIESNDPETQSYHVALATAGIPDGSEITGIEVQVCWDKDGGGAVSTAMFTQINPAPGTQDIGTYYTNQGQNTPATQSETFNPTPFVWDSNVNDNTTIDIGVIAQGPSATDTRVRYIAANIIYNAPREPGTLAYGPVTAVPVGGGFMLIALGLLMAGVAFVVMRRSGTSGHMAAIMVLAVGGFAVSISGANLVHKAWAGVDMISLDIPSGGVVDVPPGDWTFVNNTGIDQTILQLRLPFCPNDFLVEQLEPTPECYVGLVLANGDMCTTSTTLNCPPDLVFVDDVK